MHAIRTKKVVSAVVEDSGLLFLFRRMWCAYSKHLAWAESAAGMWFRYRCQACFFFYDRIWAYLFNTFSVRDRYAPRLHARICGPRESLWTLRKIFFGDVSSCVLGCRFMIRGRSAGPCMISRFEHKSLLCERKCVFVPCAKPAVTKKVHALKVCMSAYLAHSHVQHKI